jgi:hypothetical protein
MRAASLTSIALLIAAGLLVGDRRPAEARPEFARREGKACGFCHINPRGGGPRNQTGQEYARNDFRFPVKMGGLRDFRPRDRDAMVEVRRMLDVQHIPAAITKLSRMKRSVKGDAAKRLVQNELHSLDVKGEEVLGEARLRLRKKDAEKHREAVELLCMLVVEYRGLSIYDAAKEELRELRRDPAFKELVRREEKEAKARRLYLDAVLHRARGDFKKAATVYRKVVERHAGTRAEKRAARELKKLVG